VSRHHTLPPIVYTPAPPKPKKTERRRGVGYVQGNGEVDEAEETGEVSNTAPARGDGALPQHSLPTAPVERRLHSTTGNLSEGTLKAMLEMQEQESGRDPGGGSPVETK
jgi:hypothetical protein